MNHTSRDLTGQDRLVETPRFRAAFRQVPAPVAIVLVPAGPAGVTGITCTSATSLSGQPPMVLVAVDEKTGLAPLAERAGRFSINYLAADRAAWAQAFAARGRDLDELTAAVVTGRTQVPTLATGTTAVLECRTTAVHQGGDHWILCGEVLHARSQTDARPLLYLNGRYGTFQADEL
ncbi:flavin reductase family protein [Micromonospora sp. LH3U1]|uniref:flavin reductase family protein n=1 Tax=Micromonospora sp. LH3U1 TaxID=3018339 RepID=UPI00234ADA97|nr:flavin reductase family protein [Micromonospora sp. LH3U1]WCN78674.1 flavin reductase family protein [Micromonospora sp. LH3U1]